MLEEELLKSNSSNKDPASFDDLPQSQMEIIQDESTQRTKEEEMLYESTLRSQEEEPLYVALKGIFFTPKSDNSGAFCVIYRGETGKIIFRELWTVRSNKQPILDVSEVWELFIKDISKIGTYDKDLADKLMPLLERSLNSKIKNYLYENIEEIEFAMSEIRKTFEKALHYFVEIKTEGELFGEKRAQNGGILRDRDSSSGKTDNDNKDILSVINFGGIPLMCDPIIDPVKGCPVSSINIGDVVHVSIRETNDIARKVMNYVRSVGGNVAFPVTLVHVLESGKCAIVLKISDEISGVLNISKDVMLKTSSIPKMKEGLYNKLMNPANLILGGMILFIIFLLYLVIRLI